MEPTKVKVLKSIFIEKTGIKYNAGEEATVSSGIARKHEKTGHMKILPGKPEVSPKEK